MTDTRNGGRLQVLGSGDGSLSIRVAVDQVDEVRKLLDQDEIRYWVDSVAVSVKGRPFVTVIELGFNNDAARVQEILDQAGCDQGGKR